MISEGV